MAPVLKLAICPPANEKRFPMRTIRLRNTLWDGVCVFFYLRFRRPLVYALMAALLVLLAYQSWSADAYRHPFWAYLVVSFLFGIALIVALMMFSGLITALLNLWSPRARAVFREYTLTLTEDSLLEENAVYRAEYPWRDIYRVQRTRSRLYVYLPKLWGRPTRIPRFLVASIRVVPRRAFETSAEWEVFCAELQSRLSERGASSR